MMFNRRVAIGTLVGVGLLAMSGWASAAIVADGALGDWGVGISTGATDTVSGGNTHQGSGPSPKYGTTNYTGVITSSPSLSVATSIEDTNDLKNGYYLGPNSGGQNYDVEFLGVAIDDSYLYTKPNNQPVSEIRFGKAMKIIMRYSAAFVALCLFVLPLQADDGNTLKDLFGLSRQSKQIGRAHV